MRTTLGAHGAEVSLESLTRAHFTAMVAFDATGVWSDYLRELALTHGLDVAAAGTAATELVTALEGRPWVILIEDSITALPALAATGVPLALVSNSDGTVEARMLEHGLCQVGRGRGVELAAIVDSGAVGVEKPDPGIFDFALAAVRVRPEAAVHVGDSVRYDVEGARAAGVRPLHLDPFDLCPDRRHDHIRSIGELADLVGATGSRTG